MNTIREICQSLEQWAPLSLQEEYDNAGLITGNGASEVSGVLVCLDSTEEVVEEAIRNQCQLIVAHHPIVFKGLKKFSGGSYVERTLVKAIRENVAIYAIHTNLDNVRHGVNQKICERLGLGQTHILAPKSGLLKKLVVYVPLAHKEAVEQALFGAGAGKLGNYTECSFVSEGLGSFKPGAEANPHLGTLLQREWVQEYRLEVLVPSYCERAVLKALMASHPYEEPAFDLLRLENADQDTGSGMIGQLETPLTEDQFFSLIKTQFKVPFLKATAPLGRPIQKVAVCGGSGSFLTKTAIAAGADAYLTSDVKYHEYFDADGKVLLTDIGHFESEAFTKDLIRDFLIKKFSNIAVRISETVTNPIRYI
ncbi:MAG: Nif3-like dinuclear metal center hexameric protein [Cytophagaceae bacterium]|nr:Nif3-like dinuclear metal center hexameric protein [Cytophagaceae bacterium]